MRKKLMVMTIVLAMGAVTACSSNSSKTNSLLTSNSSSSSTGTTKVDDDASQTDGDTGNVGDTDGEDETVVSDFETLAKEGKYQSAIDLYTSDIAGSTSDESAVKSFLEDWMAEIAENIYSEDGGIDSEYKDYMYTLLQINESLLLVSSDDLSLLQSGVEDYNEGDYESAVVSLSEIDDEDIDTDAVESLKTTASEKYVDSVVEKAWAYIDAGEYTSAVDLLNAMQYTDETVDSIMTEAMTARFEETMESTTDFVTLKNLYETATDNKYIEVSADMTELYASAETSYRDDVIASVEEKVDSFEFGSALTLIDDALTVLENDDKLLACKTETEEAQEYYLLHTTVADLTDLTPYDKNVDFGIVTDANSSSNEDAFGNTYKTNVHSYDYSDDAYAIYRIDGVYVTFTGTIYCNNKNSRTVSIYGDGVLLYEETLTKTDDPIPFSLDITGVRDLKIVFDHSNVCIGNPTLTPDGDGSMD